MHGAKTLGKIASKTEENVLGDVLTWKKFDESAKSRIYETANVVREKANKLQTISQTGSGKRGRNKPGKKTAKKRKTSWLGARSKQTGEETEINSSTRDSWLVMDFVHSKPAEC